MDRSNRNAAIAAFAILLAFGLGAYFMPAVMLWLGDISTVIAAFAAIAFVGAFFAVFWLRGRLRR